MKFRKKKHRQSQMFDAVGFSFSIERDNVRENVVCFFRNKTVIFFSIFFVVVGLHRKFMKRSRIDFKVSNILFESSG